MTARTVSADAMNAVGISVTTTATRLQAEDVFLLQVLAMVPAIPVPDHARVMAPLRERLRMLMLALGEITNTPVPYLLVDEVLAHHLEGLGPHGQQSAQRLREKAAERWDAFQRGDLDDLGVLRLWDCPSGGAPRFVLALAEAVWVDIVAAARSPMAAPIVSAPPDTKAQPSVGFQVAEAYALVHAPGARLGERGDERRLVGADGRLTTEVVCPVVGRDGRAVAEIVCPEVEWEVVRAFVDRGIGRLGSLTAHRLLRWEVRVAYEQDRSGMREPSRIEIPGGWGEVAERACGTRYGTTRDEVHDLVVAQGHMRFTSSSGVVGNLLTYTDYTASGSNLITIGLGDMLLPRFVTRIEGRSTTADRARRLVPVLDLPPLVGRGQEQGSQALLQWLVLVELRVRAAELAAGGAILDAGTWARLALAAGLPHRLLDRVRDAWVSGDAEAPAFLVHQGEDRYTLGPAHSLAQALLLQGAGRSAKGRAGGAKAQVKRRARLDRLGN